MKAKGHYDSLTGLIPVLLIRRFESSSGAAMAELEVTAERFPYHPGDRIEVMARNFVEPVGSHMGQMCRTIR